MEDTSDPTLSGPWPERWPTARPAPMAETLQLFSHDIRAAMSDVLGGLRLIEAGRLDPETRLQIDRVQAAGETLAALVDAALMAAAGETRVAAEDPGMALAPWLEALRGRWSGRARERGMAFAIVAPGPLPARLRLPRMPLDRALGNLVGNALRHAGGSTVTLEIAADRDAGLTLKVRDDGAGYPEAVRAAFAAPEGAGSAPGGGLGLRIAAELTRQLGGTLALCDAPAAPGACACIALPAGALDWAGDGAASAEEAAAPDLSGLRILVAEDNLTNQTILRQILARMGAAAEFAGDGLAALEALQSRPFDIALVDIEMPRMSGLQVMQALRARTDALAALPLVALTAYVLRDNREAIYAAGADGIIGKPIGSEAEFGRAILRLAGRPAGLPEPEDVLSGAATAGAGLGPRMDEGRFAALLEAAGPEGAAELLARLDEDLRAVRARLGAGVAAGDVPAIREQTHILIALAGAVGADRLAGLAEVLNIAAKRRRLGDLAALHAPCLAELDALVARVAARRAGA